MALAWSKFRKSEINPAQHTGGELKVLLYLAINTDADNTITLTYEVLAQACEFSRRYAVNCVKQLALRGMIQYRAEKGRYLRIFLCKGWGYGNTDEPIPVPPGWNLATYTQEVSHE